MRRRGRSSRLAAGAVALVTITVPLACADHDQTARTSGGGADVSSTDASPSDDATPHGEAPAATFREVGRADEPVDLVAVPGTDVVLVAERAGRVVAYHASGSGLRAASSSPVLDLRERIVSDNSEQGLLGLAVSHDGSSLFVDYTKRGGSSATTIVERYALHGTTVDRSSGETLLQVRQPYDNHNGGSLVVGPDGALYVGMGDGGDQGDPQDRAQDPDGSFGRILRIALDGSKPTTWAMGLRNPWRFSIDPATGDLWIGDVGGSEREEVDRLEGSGPSSIGGRGANLGWSRREGTITPDDDEGGRGDPSRFVPPVYDYSHDADRCSIVGGDVVRSPSGGSLQGHYLFGDFCSGEVWALDPATAAVSPLGKVAQLSSFGLDNAGRYYALSLDGGIYRIDRA